MVMNPQDVGYLELEDILDYISLVNPQDTELRIRVATSATFLHKISEIEKIIVNKDYFYVRLKNLEDSYTELSSKENRSESENQMLEEITTNQTILACVTNINVDPTTFKVVNKASSTIVQ